MENEEKIINLLGMIHKENIAIMSTVLMTACYPQDYDSINNDTIENWEGVFNNIMGINDDEEEQPGANDDSGTADSD